MRFLLVAILAAVTFGTRGQAELDTLRMLIDSTVLLNSPREEVWFYQGEMHRVLLQPLKGGSAFPMQGGPTASGFMLRHHGFLYLVTAAHVAEEMKGNSTITYRTDDGRKQTEQLAKFVGGPRGDGSLAWVKHPTEDVAVIRLNTLPPSKVWAAYKTDRVITSLDPPSRSRDVTIVGFPDGVSTSGDFAAVSRTAKVGSDRAIAFMEGGEIRTGFYLDQPTVPGLSGGPAIFASSFSTGANLTIGDDMPVLGLVMGNAKTGFGLIVPGKFIIETLDLASTPVKP